MKQRPPISTRSHTPLSDTTFFRSSLSAHVSIRKCYVDSDKCIYALAGRMGRKKGTSRKFCPISLPCNTTLKEITHEAFRPHVGILCGCPHRDRHHRRRWPG